MLVNAKYLGDGYLETIQSMGHSPKIVGCKFDSVEPAQNSSLVIESNDIIRGELDSGSYKMRFPINQNGETVSPKE